MNFAITLRPADRSAPTFTVEVDAPTGDTSAALALAGNPGATVHAVYPAGDPMTAAVP